MARKILNRKALREEVEAAEEAGLIDETEEQDEEQEEGESEDEGKPKKKAKAPKRKSKAKEPVQVRMKLCWGVYNANTRVALY